MHASRQSSHDLVVDGAGRPLVCVSASTLEPSPDDQRQASMKNNGRAIRWTAILVILGLCVAGYVVGWFEVCAVETVNSAGATSITRTCGPPGVADGGVLAVGLLLLLLAMPDMSEVGILGLSMKRRLEAAEEDASSSKAKADRLEDHLLLQSLRIDGVSQAMASAAAQASVGDILIGDAAIERAKSGLDAKAEAFKRGTRAQDQMTDENGRPDAQDAMELIRNWEMLAASLDLPPYRRGASDGVARVPLTASQAADFSGAFRNELSIVRAARNTVAHAGVLSRAELQDATDISARMVQILRELSAGKA